MALFGKKKEEDSEENTDEKADEKPAEKAGSQNAEIIKIQAQLEGFAEVRKATNERFTRISEQMGELRGMILDTNKMVQQIEIKTVKTVDMVEAVQPDKFMVDLRKQDAKIEALKANIESNESMMQTLMNEVKQLRNRLNVFRGIESVVKLNKEVKEELLEIKKTKATVERHGDRAEGIFIEIQKRVAAFDTFETTLKDLNVAFKKITEDFDVVKLNFNKKADKKDVEKVISKLDKFEKEYSRLIKLMTSEIKDYKEKFQKKMDRRFDEANHIMKVLTDLTEVQPNVDDNLQNVQDLVAQRRAIEAKDKAEDEAGEKKLGFFQKMFKKKKKEEEKKEE